MSRINEIAYVCGLDVVETTTGMNGYPQNIKKAIAWQYKHPQPLYGYKKRIERFYSNM